MIKKTLKGFLFLTVLTILAGNDFINPELDQSRFCYVYGTISVVDDPRNAHFSVFVEESEGLADLIIYKEEIRLYADRKGIWHFMWALPVPGMDRNDWFCTSLPASNFSS